MATTGSTREGEKELPLAVQAHKGYIRRLSGKREGFEHWGTEHLKMSGLYWGLCALDMLDALPADEEHPGEEEPVSKEGTQEGKPALLENEAVTSAKGPNRKELVAWVLACQRENGGFGGSIGHDAHLLYTLCAVQVLAILDALDLLDRDRTAAYVASLQRPDGAFMGDEWGEVDTRFVYCALNCLSLLGRLPAKEGQGGAGVDVEKAVTYLLQCRNFDGAFGCVPGAESHAGPGTFACVAALAIVSTLPTFAEAPGDHKGALGKWVDGEQLGWWLCERQVEDGGLNGRPEKLADVCYSWWVLSALCLLDRLSWIDTQALAQFILRCQDVESGGIADRPGDMVDIFHTFFGIGGLSLLGYPEVGDGDRRIDPAYALTRRTCSRLGLSLPWDSSSQS